LTHCRDLTTPQRFRNPLKMNTQEPAPRRRGRPPKPVPVTPSWVNQISVALRLNGLDPAHSTVGDVTRALVPNRRSSHLRWEERVLLPVVPVVCDLIGNSKATVYRLAREGELEMVRAGGRTTITSASLQRYLRDAMARSTGPAPPPQLVRGKRRKAAAD
jgi:excisionase family DNA binding protein